MRQLFILIMIGTLGLSVACQKRTTKSKAAAPTGTGTTTGGGSGTAGYCEVDSTQLALTTAVPALGKVDASKLIVRELIVNTIYEDKVPQLLITFNTPASDKAEDYIPDYGLVEVTVELDSSGQPVSEGKDIWKIQVSDGEALLPVPHQYWGATFSISASACVLKHRSTDPNNNCGSEPAKIRHVMQAIVTEGPLTETDHKINNTLIKMVQNSNLRAEICGKLFPYSAQFIQSMSSSEINSLTEGEQHYITVAQLSVNDTVKFMNMCSTNFFQQLYEGYQIESQANQQANQGSGLFLTNDDCTGGTGTGEGSGTGTGTGNENLVNVEDLKNACEARGEDYTWNVQAQTCDQVALTTQKANCDSKADEGYAWDEEGSYCVKTEEVAVGNEADCTAQGGEWKDNICTLTETDTSYFQWGASINSVYDSGTCLVASAAGSSITSIACDQSASEQLFLFEKADDYVVIKSEEESTCIAVGAEVDGDYPVTSKDCDKNSNSQRFSIKDVKYEGADLMVFESKVSDTINVCLQKTLGGNLEAMECVAALDPATKEPQLFKIKAAGGAAAGLNGGEVFGFSSLVSENNEDGNLCLQAGTEQETALSLQVCDEGEVLQRFESESTGALKSEYETQLTANRKDEQKCLDYTSGTLTAAKCSVTLTNQRFTFSDTKVVVAGVEGEQAFYRISKNDGSKDGTCLTAAADGLKFENCIESLDYKAVKSQLFSTNLGGGKRDEFTRADEQAVSFGEWTESKFSALGAREGFITLAVVSALVVAGAGYAFIKGPAEITEPSGIDDADNSPGAKARKRVFVAKTSFPEFADDFNKKLLNDGIQLRKKTDFVDRTAFGALNLEEGDVLPKGAEYIDGDGEIRRVNADAGYKVQRGDIIAVAEGTKFRSSVDSIEIFETKTGKVLPLEGDVDRALQDIKQGKATSLEFKAGGTAFEINPRGGFASKIASNAKILGGAAAGGAKGAANVVSNHRRKFAGAAGIVGLVATVGFSSYAASQSFELTANSKCSSVDVETLASSSEKVAWFECHLGDTMESIVEQWNLFRDLEAQKEDLLLEE